jgi:hypothetical protein
VKALEPLPSSGSRLLLDRAYFETGRGYALGRHWQEAHDWYRRSVDLWKELQHKGLLAGTYPQRLAQAVQAVEESERHLR